MLRLIAASAAARASGGRALDAMTRPPELREKEGRLAVRGPALSILK